MTDREQAQDSGGRRMRAAPRIVWPALVPVIVASFALSSAQVQAQQAQAQSGAPVRFSGQARATGGDTLRIGEHHVRLWGIDAPDENAACGDLHPSHDARAALREIVHNRTVQCTVRETDRHGRAVSVCTVGGRDISATLVGQGWARDWPRHSCGAYAAQESPARAAHRGLWGVQCPALWGNRNYAADQCRSSPQAH